MADRTVPPAPTGFTPAAWASLLHRAHRDGAEQVIARHLDANAGNPTALDNWHAIREAFARLG